MDKNNSFRCVKCALVAGNTLVIALGLTGFIIGLVTPDVLFKYDPYNASYNYGVTGSQLALVSSIVVLIAIVGLIGAIREHFYLLLVYIICLLGMFLFRLAWSLTSHLHQSERFIMDITISLTLLSSLAKLFLLIFAILEAFTIQNSLPLTKQKFLMLKSMLKPKPKTKKVKKSTKPKPALKGKINFSDSNIYATSGSIYGSGRRRSPSRMNGHHYASQSSRARKYLPGVEYSPSPNNSHSSNDTNNNQKNNSKDGEKTRAIPNDTVDQQQHWHPKKLINQHYYHFQAPTPTTPTTSETNQFSNQPFFNYQTPNRSSLTKVTQSNNRTLPSVTESHSERSTLPITVTSTKPLYTITTSSYASTYSKPFSYTSPTSPPPVPSSYLKYAAYSNPRSTPMSTGPKATTHTTSSVTSPTGGSYLKNSSYTPITANTKSLTSRQYASSPSIVTTTTTNTPTSSTRPSSIFTTPSYSSTKPANLFNYASVFGNKSSSTPVTTPATTSGPTSNLSQTRNLFSTYISPLSEQNRLSRTSPDTTSPLSYLKSPLSSPISSPTYQHRDPIKPQGASTSRSTYSSPSPSTTSSAPAQTTSSTSTLFARLYPKSYEDYVKSYRYPEQSTSTTTNNTLSLINRVTSPEDNTQIMSNTVTGYNGKDGINSTTTFMSTTTQQHERTEHQKQSIFYQQIIREA